MFRERVEGGSGWEVKGKEEENEEGEDWFISDVCEGVPPDIELIELRES
jgi:hypothetical protein